MISKLHILFIAVLSFVNLHAQKIDTTEEYNIFRELYKGTKKTVKDIDTAFLMKSNNQSYYNPEILNTIIPGDYFIMSYFSLGSNYVEHISNPYNENKLVFMGDILYRFFVNDFQLNFDTVAYTILDSEYYSTGEFTLGQFYSNSNVFKYNRAKYDRISGERVDAPYQRKNPNFKFTGTSDYQFILSNGGRYEIQLMGKHDHLRFIYISLGDKRCYVTLNDLPGSIYKKKSNKRVPYFEINNYLLVTGYGSPYSSFMNHLRLIVIDTLCNRKDYVFYESNSVVFGNSKKYFYIHDGKEKFVRYKMGGNSELIAIDSFTMPKEYLMLDFGEKNEITYALFWNKKWNPENGIKQPPHYKFVKINKGVKSEWHFNKGNTDFSQPMNIQINTNSIFLQNGEKSIFFFQEDPSLHSSYNGNFSYKSFRGRYAKMMLYLPLDILSKNKNSGNVSTKILFEKEFRFNNAFLKQKPDASDTNEIIITPCLLKNVFTQEITLLVTRTSILESIRKEFSRLYLIFNKKGWDYDIAEIKNFLTAATDKDYDQIINCGEYVFLYSTSQKKLYIEAENKIIQLTGGIKEAITYAVDYLIKNSEILKS